MTISDREFLASLLAYDPDTGVLTWKWRDESMFSSVRTQRMWNTRFSGKPAGRLNQGYIELRMLGRKMLAHRIIWTLMTGDEPPEEIDHDNGVKHDNRWENLNASTKQKNAKNLPMPTRNRTGVMGVHLNKYGRFVANGYANGRRVHLGYFDDLETAAAVRKDFEKANGYNPNHGRTCHDRA